MLANIKLKSPILPNSRVKPIRTRNILAKMHRHNEFVVKSILASIANDNPSSSSMVFNNSADDEGMSAEDLLWLYGLIDVALNTFTSQSNIDIMTSYMNQSFNQGWKYTNDSVKRQLEDVLQSSRFSLVERIPYNDKTATEMLDVLIEENKEQLKSVLRKEVKQARGELKSVDECLKRLKSPRVRHSMVKKLDSSFGNEINMVARTARKVYTDVNSPTLKGITSEVKKAAQGLNEGVLGGVDITVTDETPIEEEVTFKLLWTSALLPTTRSWHASRHGHTFTQKEVDEFYAENGNSFNCHCSQDVIVDGLDRVSNNVLERMEEEKRKWLHGKGNGNGEGEGKSQAKPSK